ncbi:hypothetical protein GF338_08765, partial [candidate division WOR-3 bacterium]|nr:hypothetical protein [candidate division WOR-3 bacterium]
DNYNNGLNTLVVGDNSFVVRATGNPQGGGGVTFYSSGDKQHGVRLRPGSDCWEPIDQNANCGGGTGNFWSLNGNSIAQGDVLGTTNPEDLVLVVNGSQAILIDIDQNHPGGKPNIIAGGPTNSVTGSSFGSNIGGGRDNEIIDGDNATIPGGKDNTAQGDCSFAAGHDASASKGSFVWSCYNGGAGSFSDGGTTDRFVVNANRHFFFTHTSTLPPDLGLINTSAGCPSGTYAYLSLSGVWTDCSSREMKEGFTPVDEHKILQKVANLPITSWHYTTGNTTAEHIGPVAEDFYAAFGVGESDRHLASIDVNGVALASIQALYQQNQEKDAQIAELEEQVDDQQAQLEYQQKTLNELQARLSALEESK